MKRLVLVEDHKVTIPMFHWDRGCFPLPSMFIGLECDETGKVMDSADNQKAINEAFMRALNKRNGGSKY